MKTRQLIGAGAMALLLVPAAFANNASTASTSNPASCKTLEVRFDKAAQGSHAADLSKAKLLRTEGAELCTQGKTTEGARKLEEAVKMLGQSPASN